MFKILHKPCTLFTNNFHLPYCKYASLSFADKLFDRMPIRELGVWNPPITGKGVTGIDDQLCNDTLCYVRALKVCARNRDSRNGSILHGLVVVSGLAHRVLLTNSLIDLYSECGMIDEVRFVFDYANDLDDVSWNLLVSAYVRAGWTEVAFNILVWMHRNEVKLNSVALGSVLEACRKGCNSKQLDRLLHGCMIKLGLDLDFLVGSSMHHIFVGDDGLNEAMGVFDCISNPSLVVFNVMIRGFARLDTEEVALKLCVEMMRRGMLPSIFTFKSVVEACISKGDFIFGKQIHAQIIKKYLEEDESLGNTLSTMYLNCVDSSPSEEIFTWASMIREYIQNGLFEKAIEAFKDLLKHRRKPDNDIISNLMVSSGNFGAIRSGEQIHCFGVREGLDQFTVCSNSQMFFYATTGDIEASVKIFKAIGTVDAISWSLLILSHALNGCAKDALSLFVKMKESEFSPEQSTLLAVLYACSHGGLFDQGFRYFESMVKEYGLAPNVEHCALAVYLLGQAGKLAEAEDFIFKSNFPNDPVMWSSLLHFCQIHGDTERSIHIGEKLIELDPLSSRAYMTLHDTYSAKGKMSLAMKTRGRMRERGVNKETDLSWIEIGASVHCFVSGDGDVDVSRPQQSHVVLNKLEEMLTKLRANSKVKLLDSEFQTEKWKKHGEMMAVALGMAYLPDSVQIRVMKNSRACRDCHMMLKLISESEGRKIILRDMTRFHHFSGSSCSCRDRC